MKGTGSIAVTHNESTSCPSISANSEGVNLIDNSSVSVPSVSVTAEGLSPNGHSLDQAHDSIGLLVDDSPNEREPNDDTTLNTKQSNANTRNDLTAGICNKDHKQVQAKVSSPTASVEKPKTNSSNAYTKKTKPNSSAHVLTSAESIALLEEKTRKKAGRKRGKKKEREMKKNLREEEKNVKHRKEKPRQKKVDQKKTKERRQKRGNELASTRNKRQRLDESGIQHRKVSANECATCFELYEDD